MNQDATLDVFEYMLHKYKAAGRTPEQIAAATDFVQFASKTLADNPCVGYGFVDGVQSMVLQNGEQVRIVPTPSTDDQAGGAIPVTQHMESRRGMRHMNVDYGAVRVTGTDQ